MNGEKAYRVSGHESFPCRYTWLPKAVQGLARDVKLFGDEDQAMVTLGVGKNMVRSIRFSACNGKRTPLAVNDRGVRREWVGIGWIDVGEARGDEVVVAETFARTNEAWNVSRSEFCRDILGIGAVLGAALPQR